MNTEVRSSIDTLLTTLKERLAQPGTSLLPLLTTMSRFTSLLARQPVPDLRATPRRHARVRLPRLEQGRLPGPQGRARHRDLRADALRQQTRHRSWSPTPTPHPASATASPTFSTSRRSTPSPAPTPALEAIAVASPNAHRANEQLKAFLVGHNVELEYKALQPGLLGYTNGRRITCGTGQASHVEFATLAHETTHVLLHFPADRTTRPDLVTRETEAEAVTYLLCAQLGIAGTEASVEYIQSYRGTPDTLDASLERIRVTAQRLSGELDAIRFDVGARSRTRRSRASKYPRAGPAKPIQGAIRDCASRAAGGVPSPSRRRPVDSTTLKVGS